MECLLLFSKRLMFVVGHKKTHLERRFAEPNLWAKNFSIYDLISFGCCQSPVKIPPIWCQAYSLVMCCTRGIFDKEKFGVVEVVELENLDGSEIHGRRVQWNGGSDGDKR